MRAGRSWSILLLCSLASGCAGLFQIGTRNLVYEASRIKDDCDERMRYRTQAQMAWGQVVAECPDKSYSPDYAAGFQDGVVDHLMYGGKGEPPGLPPLRYRSSHAFTEHGSPAVKDWYAGFRHGAAVAIQSGYRRFVVLPLAPPLPHPPAPPPPPPHQPGLVVPVPTPPLPGYNPVEVSPKPALPMPHSPEQTGPALTLPPPRPVKKAPPPDLPLSPYSSVRLNPTPPLPSPRRPEQMASTPTPPLQAYNLVHVPSQPALRLSHSPEQMASTPVPSVRPHKPVEVAPAPALTLPPHKPVLVAPEPALPVLRNKPILVTPSPRPVEVTPTPAPALLPLGPALDEDRLPPAQPAPEPASASPVQDMSAFTEGYHSRLRARDAGPRLEGAESFPANGGWDKRR